MNFDDMARASMEIDRMDLDAGDAARFTGPPVVPTIGDPSREP